MLEDALYEPKTHSANVGLGENPKHNFRIKYVFRFRCCRSSPFPHSLKELSQNCANRAHTWPQEEQGDLGFSWLLLTSVPLAPLGPVDSLWP